jgi:hypothetical protein
MEHTPLGVVLSMAHVGQVSWWCARSNMGKQHLLQRERRVCIVSSNRVVLRDIKGVGDVFERPPVRDQRRETGTALPLLFS